MRRKGPGRGRGAAKESEDIHPRGVRAPIMACCAVCARMAAKFNTPALSRCRLRAYDGHDKSRPLLLAIKGRVLNVTTGEDYYGLDGPYKVMAGRDARSGAASRQTPAVDSISCCATRLSHANAPAATSCSQQGVRNDVTEGGGCPL